MHFVLVKDASHMASVDNPWAVQEAFHKLIGAPSISLFNVCLIKLFVSILIIIQEKPELPRIQQPSKEPKKSENKDSFTTAQIYNHNKIEETSSNGGRVLIFMITVVLACLAFVFRRRLFRRRRMRSSGYTELSRLDS